LLLDALLWRQESGVRYFSLRRVARDRKEFVFYSCVF